VFDKELWRVANGYDPVLPFGWEDWDFWIRIAQQTTLVPYHQHESLFHYRLGPNSMHKFCQAHFDVCFALLQTLHPSLYPRDVCPFIVKILIIQRIL
jgi:hypothetical protein